MRAEMLEYGLRILLLSALISVITAAMLFFAVQRLLVLPIRRVVRNMQAYAGAPEDARLVFTPTARVAELRDAEEALAQMQTELIGALRQKERLAQLGSAVAKIAHDLRNILTSVQLFADRIEQSADPVVARAAPKLVASVSRAVNLCRSTLAFGKAEEHPPRLTRFALRPLLEDVAEGEGLSPQSDPACLVDAAASLVIRADAEQLQRVISNLLRNARQAIGRRGAPAPSSCLGARMSRAGGSVSGIPGRGCLPARATICSRRFRDRRARADRAWGWPSRQSWCAAMAGGWS